jgi:hypothetical protein
MVHFYFPLRRRFRSPVLTARFKALFLRAFFKLSRRSIHIIPALIQLKAALPSHWSIRGTRCVQHKSCHTHARDKSVAPNGAGGWVLLIIAGLFFRIGILSREKIT